LTIWRGSHTLTRGRPQSRMPPKISPPPNCILLGHFHPCRAQLQHLQMRTTCSGQSAQTLETTFRVHSTPLYDSYRPRKPRLLERTERPEQVYGPMAYSPPRLLVQHPGNVWEVAHGGRLPIATTLEGQGRRGQQTSDCPPRSPICRLSSQNPG
jgi:hypothetical protein